MTRPDPRPRNGRERGSVTAEFAMALPVALLLLFAGLTAVSAVTVRLQCLDAAREAALAGARGEPAEAAARRRAPPGADVAVDANTETVHARVTADVPLLGSLLPPLRVSGEAVAATEPREEG